MIARRLAATLAALAVAGSASAAAVGDALDDAELPTIDGARAALLSPAALANVLVFFRPGQDHSLEALRELARCEREFAGKPVHWVAIVSARAAPDEVRAFVGEAGIGMPVVVDEGDRLYGALGVRVHPAVAIADQRRRLVAYEPFRKVNYCDRLRGRIRLALGEIDAAELARIDRPEKALFPNEIPGAVPARHVHLGEALLRTGHAAQAAEEARRVLAREPGNAAAQDLLRRALAAQAAAARATP